MTAIFGFGTSGASPPARLHSQPALHRHAELLVRIPRRVDQRGQFSRTLPVNRLLLLIAVTKLGVEPQRVLGPVHQEEVNPYEHVDSIEFVDGLAYRPFHAPGEELILCELEVVNEVPNSARVFEMAPMVVQVVQVPIEEGFVDSLVSLLEQGAVMLQIEGPASGQESEEPTEHLVEQTDQRLDQRESVDDIKAPSRKSCGASPQGQRG